MEKSDKKKFETFYKAFRAMLGKVMVKTKRKSFLKQIKDNYRQKYRQFQSKMRDVEVLLQTVQRIQESFRGVKVGDSKGIIDRLYEIKVSIPSDVSVSVMDQIDKALVKSGVSEDILTIINDKVRQQKQSMESVKQPAAGQTVADPLIEWIDHVFNPWTLVEYLKRKPEDAGSLMASLDHLRLVRGDKEYIRFMVVLVQAETPYQAEARNRIIEIYGDLLRSFKRDPLLVDLVDYYQILTPDLMEAVNQAHIDSSETVIDPKWQSLLTLIQQAPQPSEQQVAQGKDLLRQAVAQAGIQPDQALRRENIPDIMQRLGPMIQELARQAMEQHLQQHLEHP